jgi:hypothetical protein
VNFGLFWEREQDAKKRSRLLRTIFESVTAFDRKLVAVTPREAFLPYFQFAVGGRERRERRDSNPHFPTIEVRPPRPSVPALMSKTPKEKS